MKNQTVAILGGTGKAGKYIVNALLAAGYHLKLLVKDPEFHSSEHNIEFVGGNAKDYDAVYHLLFGCDFVVSAVGQRTGETGVFSQSTTNILKAMKEFNIMKYISLTGLNVDTVADQKGPATAFGTAWMKENYPLSTADKQVEYDHLLRSTVSWTLIRLPMIHLTDVLTELNVSLTDCPGDHINAGDLGQFVIRLLNTGDYNQAAPFIASS